MSLSRSNGRPEPEVIVNFSDGFAYSKAKMEAAFRPGGLLDRDNLPAKIKEARPHIKREDVDLLVQEFELPRAQAEKHLAANGGSLDATLKALITPST